MLCSLKFCVPASNIMLYVVRDPRQLNKLSVPSIFIKDHHNHLVAVIFSANFAVNPPSFIDLSFFLASGKYKTFKLCASPPGLYWQLGVKKEDPNNEAQQSEAITEHKSLPQGNLSPVEPINSWTLEKCGHWKHPAFIEDDAIGKTLYIHTPEFVVKLVPAQSQRNSTADWTLIVLIPLVPVKAERKLPLELSMT